MTSKSIPEMAIDTRLLIGHFQKAEMGNIITYSDMEKIVGRSMSGADPNLRTVLKVMERDYDMVFRVVRGEGYKRLSDKEIVASSAALPKRLRRMTRKSIKTLSKARDEHLTRDEIVQRNAAVSFAGTLAFMSSNKSVGKLESAIKHNAASELPVGKTLEVFKS